MNFRGTSDGSQHTPNQYISSLEMSFVSGMCCPIPAITLIRTSSRRFSFYGLRAVLWLFFNEYLKFSETTSTSAYHSFVFFSYATPLIGAVLADSYLGVCFIVRVRLCAWLVGNACGVHVVCVCLCVCVVLHVALLHTQTSHFNTQANTKQFCICLWSTVWEISC